MSEREFSKKTKNDIPYTIPAASNQKEVHPNLASLSDLNPINPITPINSINQKTPLKRGRQIFKGRKNQTTTLNPSPSNPSLSKLNQKIHIKNNPPSANLTIDNIDPLDPIDNLNPTNVDEYTNYNYTLSNHSTCETKNRKKEIYENFNSITNNNINKINNLKPKIKNKKNKNYFYPLYSSSSSSSSSLISDDSFNIYKNKKLNLDDDYMFNYPTRKEIGLYSSEDDSIEIDNSYKENLENEIEKYLIEIYNKNISNCNYNNGFDYCKECERKVKYNNIKGGSEFVYYNNSCIYPHDHCHYYNKYYLKKLIKRENKNEFQISFKDLNEQYNYYALQALSKKIKELIIKYKKKISESPEITNIYKKYIKAKNEIIKINKINQISQTNKAISNPNIMLTNITHSNLNQSTPSPKSHKSHYSSSPLSDYNDKIISKSNNNNILNIINNLLIPFESNVSSTLLKNENFEQEITNILIKELINIKHTLKKSSYEIQQLFKYPLSLLNNRYSIEKIQLEAYNDILLNDELISTLLLQIKFIYCKNNNPEILRLIEIIEEDKKYGYKEMSFFDKELKELVRYNEGEGNDRGNNNNGEGGGEEDEGNNKVNIMLNNSSDNNNNCNGNNNTLSNENVYCIKDDISIDELVKFIDNDDSSKKKKKKKRKNKNKKGDLNIGKGNKYNVDITGIVNNNGEFIHDEDIDLFKKDISNTIIDSYLCNKIIPKFSDKWMNKLNNDEE